MKRKPIKKETLIFTNRFIAEDNSSDSIKDVCVMCRNIDKSMKIL